ncbi:hypothetical protein LTR84_011909 [Exophiala bonariae]|uniref:ABM domain-containing protein n=1 Tax=Exophiala bonariae TaxID=1690606 RepID=A0AAV9NKZ0_9EURO|nr:hypothetical protein LTR84_011909 [Exophiala bonariae]
MVVTEIALLPLQQSCNPEDTNSIASQIHDSAVEVILSQPGAHRVRWGRRYEDNPLLMWFVDWDNIESHTRFMAVYEPFLKEFGGILDTGARAYHADFVPYGKAETPCDARSRTTQIITMWFPDTYSEVDKHEVESQAQRFVATLENVASYNSSVGGWVREMIDIPGTIRQGKAYVLLVSWDLPKGSLEAREGDAIKNNFKFLWDARGLEKLEVVHSTLVEVTRISKGLQGRSNL